MRNSLTLLGLGFIIVFGGAFYAFNRSFTPASENDDRISNSSTTSMANLSLTSTDFENGGVIPTKFTCDGQQINPQLSISGVPEGTKSLALLMDDPDIPQVFKEQRGIDSFDHWTLFNLPAGRQVFRIESGEVPEGAVVGANGAGKNEYIGPCPPREYEPSEHRYFFKLFALDSLLALPEGATKKQVEEAMQGHVIAKTELVGRYKRP